MPMTETEKYDRIMDGIRWTVDRLNTALGIGPDADHRVTYGYVGNCDGLRPDGTWAKDDRLWSVFLPHPGRVGTAADRIGSWRTGDAAEAGAAAAALTGALALLTWQSDSFVAARMAEQRKGVTTP